MPRPANRVSVLPDAAAQTVSRILLDMPDTGAWKQNALRILPHYRSAVETLLAQDKHSDDPERRFRAMVWESDLKLGPSQNPPPGKFRAPPRRFHACPEHVGPGVVDREFPGR